MTHRGAGTAESIAEINARVGNGYFSRPTEYRGVHMRSRLEVDFAWHLDTLGIEWTYEPAIYGPRGQGYLPDFRIDRPSGPCFVEVKPTLEEAEKAKGRMPVIWRTHPEAVLLIACAEESTFFERGAGEPWRSWRERWAHR